MARLDTCVTLVDAVNFMADFHTADFLVDRHRKEGEQVLRCFALIALTRCSPFPTRIRT